MIYKITNNINGKIYIGKTEKTLEERWYKHVQSAKYGSNTYFHKAIRKHGAENFSICFLMAGLDDEEVACILEYKPDYNMTAGGTGGNTSNSINYKTGMLRRSYKGENNPMYGKYGVNNPNFGSKRSIETCERIKNSDYLKKKRRPVTIDNVNYDSVQAAARAHNKSERWVRLHDTRRIPLDGKIQAQDN